MMDRLFFQSHFQRDIRFSRRVFSFSEKAKETRFWKWIDIFEDYFISTLLPNSYRLLSQSVTPM